jgi:hypothetical protein
MRVTVIGHQARASAVAEFFCEVVAAVDGVADVGFDREGVKTDAGPVHALTSRRPAPIVRGKLIMGIRRATVSWRSILRDYG